jgi:hypothetical protein
MPAIGKNDKAGIEELLSLPGATHTRIWDNRYSQVAEASAFTISNLFPRLALRMEHL